MSPDLTYTRRNHPDGSATFLIGENGESYISRIKQAANGEATETPTPTNDEGAEEGGPVTRFANVFSPLGMGILEHLGLDGHEIASDVRTRVSELYRNEFPVLKPRFERKCTDCGAEYSERVEDCPECDAETREPDPGEKRAIEELAESVNKEGQSLRELAKTLEWDQWLSVPVLVLRHEYALAPSGEVVRRNVSELVKGDAKRIVPVVDEHRRIGNYWWACPRCREHEDYEAEREPGGCEHCDAPLREVYFAEHGDDSTDMASYYFEEEVLTFPWAYPRLHGLDGLPPVHHVWLKQLIIDFQDRYAAAFYDPESDRLPNQFMILHTTNPDAWEELLEQARQSAKDDEYDIPLFSMEYDSMANERPEVQVVDAMPDELLGQNQDLRDTFKKDIRQAIGISDVFDSDMKEAGGLNNEGLQIEVTDRSIATQMHDYMTGWLDELAKRLGIEDWQFAYIEAAGPDAEDLRNEVEAGIQAEQAGLDARFADGQVEIADGEFEPVEPAPDAGMGAPGGGLPMSDTESGGDGSSHEYGPTLQRAAPEDLSDATETLFKAHQHVVWPDLVESRAEEPFWSDTKDVPEFVKALIEEALRGGAISTISEKLPAGTTRADVRNFFQDQLNTPGGWSLRSITENYADRFGVSEDEAVTAVRTQTTSILNEAREEGYRRQGDADGAQFKWIGPDDNDVTDTCQAIKAATNPDFGGEPNSLDELKNVVLRERADDFPTFQGPATVGHWNCRHTYVEHFE